ncbi:MAG: flagellar motor protein MotB [Candidatus Binataceae bacterium]
MEHEEGGGGHDSSERWLVSYADFITLLFALFVLMYAMSMQSTDKVNRAWTAMATGVGVRPHRGGSRPELGETARGGAVMTELSRKALTDLRDSMTAALREFKNSGVSIRLDGRGLVVSLSAARFFASGDADIAPQQMPVLAAVAQQLNGRPNPLEIDGFTDPLPIHDSRFRDNWELSAARAATVVRYLSPYLGPCRPAHPGRLRSVSSGRR